MVNGEREGEKERERRKTKESVCVRERGRVAQKRSITGYDT